jgi:hypothetical protein
MGWFRSKREAVAWLAFFALACQLVLTFGHVHTFGHIHLGKISSGAAAAVAADGGGIFDPSPSSPQKSPTGLPDDFCAICANIGLANALVVPHSPIIIVPVSFVYVLPRSLAAAAPASFDHLPFSARGPPLA